MRNFSIIAKGKYSHKQTSELLEITRYLIVRKKKGRVLLLDMNNHSEENLTAMELRIEQFDARGNSLGTATVKLDGLSIAKGEFVLKKEISVHRACIDFRVKVLDVEYGNYAYRLGGADTFVTYEKEVVRKPVDRKKMRKKLGNRNFLAKRRKFAIPLFVSVFVALLLMIPPVITFTQTYVFDNNGEKEFHLKNVQYEFTEANYNDKTPVNVIGYDGIGGQNIVIPAILDGHPVKAVKAEAFKQNFLLETLTVASGVVIEERAFAECPFLKKVVLQGTANVGKEAFYNCDSLVSVEAENVNQIGEKAFFDCSALKSVRIVSKKDDGAMTLGEKAFGRCGSFDEIYVKRFINYGEKCDYFQSAFKVESLYLQNYNYASYVADGVVDRPLNALFGGIDCEVKNVRIAYTDGIPADFTSGCEEVLQTVKIDAMEDKKVGDRAFLKCKALTSVSFPVAITSVGESAFEESGIASFDCSALTSIGVNAFKDCARLKAIKLSDSLKNVPINAFNGCESLTSITVPKGVMSIGTGAFKGCKRVETVTFDTNGKLAVIMPEAFAGIRKVRRIDLPEKIETVGEKAFADCRSLRYLTIPKSAQSIDKDAFENCYKLYEIENYGKEYIRVGSGVGKYAFKVYTSANDARLEKVTQNGFVLAQRKGEWFVMDYTGKGGSVSMPAPSSVPSYKVVPYLFGENDSVKKVTVSSRVTDMGDGMFLDSAVEEVYFENRYNGVGITSQTFAGATSLKKVDMSECGVNAMYQTMTLPEKAFADCTGLTEVKLFNGIRTVSAGAFLHCKNLKTVSGCYNAIFVKESAFKGCSKLQSVDISSNVQEIGAHAFYDCSALDFEDPWTFTKVQKVGDESFKYCEKLSGIQFSADLVELGESAFEGCASLRLAFINGQLEEIKDHTFLGCMQLQDLYLSPSIKTIGEKAFYNCIRLKELSLPLHLETLGNSAFRNAKELRLVVFDGQQVFSVGEKAFYNCESLTSVSGLNGNIGVSAFENCVSLNVIVLMNTQNLQAFDEYGVCNTVVSARAFYGCEELESVLVPESIVEIGESAFEGCPILHEVINLSSLVMERDSVENGMIAFNALVVSDNTYNRLERVDYGKFQFKRNNYAYFLTDYTGNAKVIELGGQELQDGENTYYIYSDYEIARYAFEKHDGIQRITLGDRVSSIRTGAFNELKNLKEVRLLNTKGLVLRENTFCDCGNLARVVIAKGFNEINASALGEKALEVYYLSTQSDWFSACANYHFPYFAVRYYINEYGVHECVHEHNEGLCWEYDSNGNISTKIKPYKTFVAEEPTCEKNGVRVYCCDSCTYRREEILAPYGHSYQNGVCSRCKHIYRLLLSSDTMKTAEQLANVTLSGDKPFEETGTGYRTPDGLQIGEIAKFEIEAKEWITVEFTCTSFGRSGTLTIKSDGQETKVVGSQSFSVSLHKGDKLTVVYEKTKDLSEDEEYSQAYEYGKIQSIYLTQEIIPE